MSRIQEIFEETVADLVSEEVVSAEATADGVWRLVAGGDTVDVALGDDDGDFVCFATVGNIANVSEKDMLLEDALKANCLWNETEGATLSLEPETDTLVLADRREADFVDSVKGLETYLAQFLTILRKWKRYVADCSPAGVPEVVSDTPALELGEEGISNKEARLLP